MLLIIITFYVKNRKEASKLSIIKMYEYFKDAKPEGKNDVAAQFLRASV
jgi:hypothetical protein